MARRGSNKGRSRRISKRKQRAAKRSSKRTVKRTVKKAVKRTVKRKKGLSLKRRLSRLAKSARHVAKRAAGRGAKGLTGSRNKPKHKPIPLTTKFRKAVESFKKPKTRKDNTITASGILSNIRIFGIKPPIPRLGKILENSPRIAELMKFPKLPKLNIPNIPNPFTSISTGLLGLKNRIPKIGFPEFPKMPDIGGFFKSKVEDVSEIIQDGLGAAGNVAEDWKANQKRKKIIRYVIIAVFLGILGAFAFRKK